MYNINIYNKKIDFNNMTYSVDMLRLKTYITYAEFNSIEFCINTVYKDNIKKFWISERIMNFHYNYVMEFDGVSFWFGFMHNNEGVNYNREELKYNFTIEFNPNKLRDNPFLVHILNKFYDWYIRSFDLAIDIPINILDLIIDKSGKRRFLTISNGGDDVTFEVGKGEGRFKIYNKKRESNLNIVGHLTRVEVSLKYDDFPISNIKRFSVNESLFPYLYLNEYVFSFSDYTQKDKMLMAVLYAVQSGYPINDLTRTYKKKIQNMLEAGSQIKFDKLTSIKVLQQTIYYYFMRRESRQVIF